jgi:hypothetical protein
MPIIGMALLMGAACSIQSPRCREVYQQPARRYYCSKVCGMVVCAMIESTN